MAIAIMYDSANAALLFPSVEQALGTGPACSQLSRLIGSLLGAKDRLSEMGPIVVSGPRRLKQLDVVLMSLPTLGSHAMSCGLTVPVADATSELLGIKAQLVERLQPARIFE